MANSAETDRLLSQIRAELHELSERVQRLEQARTTPAPAVAPPGTEAAATAELPEETLLVISAAVAAFLGERAHVRQIRLTASPAWAQQGRVSIQASHLLHSHR